MILATAAFLLAAEVLQNPADVPMTVTVELRVVTSPVVPGREIVVEGTVANPTDIPVSGCIASQRLFRVEGAAETVRVPLTDRERGRCRSEGNFSLEPGRHWHWYETIPALEGIGAGPGKVVLSLAVYQWRQKIQDEKLDVRWEIVREAPFTAAAP
jgi:hypothetical protein